MWKAIFVAVVTLFASLPARAAIFDASDILPQNSGAVSGFGEILLSDPTSEGVELHGRYGFSDDWNVAAILGVGTKNKKFRFGGEAVYNLFPDWEGQVGVSFVGTALYLQRPGSGGIQLRVAPMVHKRITGWSNLPATVYFAVPFQLEARSGTYYSASQVVLGSHFDASDDGRYYITAEAGIRLAKADSYVLAGFGIRLGDLKFNKRESRAKENPAGGRRRGGNVDRDKELTDEDFQR